jgi:hypothetical protein
MDNRQIVRGVIEQADIGTPGDGLLSPEQFDAFHALAETQHPWMQLQSTPRRTAHTGTLPRIDFGDNVLEPADESVDTGNFFEPTHDTVPYTMTKIRTAFKVSNEALSQNAAQADYENQLVDGFGRAFGRSKQRLAWLGDVASADVSLQANDGWVKQITASGVVVNGSLINGGDVDLEHFFSAVFGLPAAWIQRVDELRWAISPLKRWQLGFSLSSREDTLGANMVTTGPNGEPQIAGIGFVEVPALGNDIVLCSPQNTTEVLDNTTMTLKKVDSGLTVVSQDIIAYIGFMFSDYILREVEGCVIINQLNP